LKGKKNLGVVKAHYKKRTARTFHRLPRLSLGDCGFFYYHEFRFELIYLKMIRRRIKRLVRNAKRDSVFRQVWLNLRANYPLVKKPKNARMGKGKGNFFRWAVRLAPSRIVIEFRGFAYKGLCYVAHRCDYNQTTSPSVLTTQVPGHI
jgi:ribosomal protein L16/L10AE